MRRVIRPAARIEELPLPTAFLAVNIALASGLHTLVYMLAYRRKLFLVRPNARQVQGAIVIGLSVGVIVLASVPLAYLASPVAAQLCWLLIIPIRVITGLPPFLGDEVTYAYWVLRRSVVLVVGDVLSPVDCDVLVVGFIEGEVNHQSGGSGAVPVLLVGLDVDAVARADHLDLAAAALDQPDPFGDEETLSKWVTVPGRTSARHEVDQARQHSGRSNRPRDVVDADIAGEPLCRPLASGAFD